MKEVLQIEAPLRFKKEPDKKWVKGIPEPKKEEVVRTSS